jgi:spermidine synthase
MRLAALIVMVAFAATQAGETFAASRAARPTGPATREVDLRSKFSHIRVYRQGSIRSLVFVRDNGEEVVETMINMRAPHELMAEYCRAMFASYLFQPKPKRVLIIGLGGGAMVHFLEHYDPEVKIDAVEIDPAVVKLAEKYFKTRPTKNVNIVTDDGLRYLEKPESRYDVVYMDAFLKPSQETDSTGVPRRMKTVEFYKRVQQKLALNGVMSFNLNAHDGLDDDLKTLREAFAQVCIFRLEGGNVVAVCTRDETRAKPSELQDRAKEIDRRFKASFSFREMLK